jgi:hypothetical protein
MRTFSTTMRPGVTAALVGVAVLAWSGPALAVSLYWASTAVKTASIKECLGFADTAMRGLNFQKVRRSQNEVAGTSGGTYAAVTCVGTAPRATAIVMVAGNDGGETARVRDSLRQKVAAIVRFD